MSVPSETLDDMNIRTIPSLVALAAALGAEETGDLSAAEQRLLDEQDQDAAPAAELVLRASSLIRRGEDPLGDAYCAIRSPGERRPLGQTYTPHPIIEAMLRWASDHGTPTRVVDPGAGSGRYLLAAGRRFPEAELHGSDVDPLATLMLRANLAAAGLAGRARIHLGDYRALALPEAEGPTLFIGNPPYVRHHQIAPEWKAWLLQTARRHGLHASALAGLHVHFFLATAEYGRRGDFGAFITSSEWLDVNYGALVRRLLLDELGGQSLHVLAPEAQPFSDATTTGAITCFRIGDTVPAMKVRRVESVSDLGRLAKGRSVSRQRLAETNRWSVLTHVTPALPEGHVELGELCRVHRGTVTGANAVWSCSEPVRGSEASTPCAASWTCRWISTSSTPPSAGRSTGSCARPGPGACPRATSPRTAGPGGASACGRPHRSWPRTWLAVLRPSSATTPVRGTSTSPTGSIPARR